MARILRIVAWNVSGFAFGWWLSQSLRFPTTGAVAVVVPLAVAFSFLTAWGIRDGMEESRNDQ